jgi:hypothetical protein
MSVVKFVIKRINNANCVSQYLKTSQYFWTRTYFVTITIVLLLIVWSLTTITTVAPLLQYASFPFADSEITATTHDEQHFKFVFFCSCCSHLEHRASVKRFVSLQFLNLRESVGLLGQGISPSQGSYLTQTQNKHKQTSMPGVGFEPTIPVFERTKTFHALDRKAKVIGFKSVYSHKICVLVGLLIYLCFEFILANET